MKGSKFSDAQKALILKQGSVGCGPSMGLSLIAQPVVDGVPALGGWAPTVHYMPLPIIGSKSADC